MEPSIKMGISPITPTYKSELDKKPKYYSSSSPIWEKMKSSWDIHGLLLLNQRYDGEKQH